MLRRIRAGPHVAAEEGLLPIGARRSASRCLKITDPGEISRLRRPSGYQALGGTDDDIGAIYVDVMTATLGDEEGGA
jgi:hypothetical protein